LHAPWREPSVSKAPSHSCTNTYPSSWSNSVPWPQSPRVACGSPRDKTEISLLFPDHDTDRDHDPGDAITLVLSLRRSNSGCGSRNHIRGGTIELSHGPALKRTPPTSPFGNPALPTVPPSTSTHQPIPRLRPTLASTHSHRIPHRSLNASPKIGSRAQVKRVLHPSQIALHPLPVGGQV
jgi:hypothetical protein